MRVLHFGNTANNGYNNAKLLRRLGIEADAACDEQHILSQPEWEDAPIDGVFDPYESLEEVARSAGWSRPEWVITRRDPFALRRFRGQYRLEYTAKLARALPRLRALHRTLAAEYEELRGELGGELLFSDLVEGFRLAWLQGLLVEPLGRVFERYDVIQAYATHAVLALIEASGRPFVAFEHGTLRELPFEPSSRGRLLSLAYRKANAVVITNPDAIVAAQRLGLENYLFVPHPVDETKYTPGESEFRKLLTVDENELLLFAPARHDWEIKGTEVMLHAFAELARQGRAAVLVLSDWGTDVERSRDLIRGLGAESRVRWVPPLPKLRLIEAYRAADVVLDQFVIPTFGGIAPEAMACGRPVVTAYDPALHAWCLPEDPPLLPATTASEAYSHVVRLADDARERERIGRAGRTWVERHHGWRLVAERQARLYESIVASA